MSGFQVHTMGESDWTEVAQLIHDSTNAWYQANRGFDIFPAGPDSTRLFCEVYESLDPGCCLIARSESDQKIIGSCFYHPRETHFSLGIMNVHPDAFGKGVARAILNQIIEKAESESKSVRLVSSAMNLDSYSLYTKAGFVPRQLFQDMLIEIPSTGLAIRDETSGSIRPASMEDVTAIRELELKVAHISREKDYRYFIANTNGYWNMSVFEDESGLRGWIVSVTHPASNMIGPCIADCESTAIALLQHEINFRRGSTMVFLVPVDCTRIVQSAYSWGAENCEMHVAQVHGDFQAYDGVVMPTFMPETG